MAIGGFKNNTEREIREKILNHEFNVDSDMWTSMENTLKQERSRKTNPIGHVSNNWMLLIVPAMLVVAGIYWWSSLNNSIASNPSENIGQHTEVRKDTNTNNTRKTNNTIIETKKSTDKILIPNAQKQKRKKNKQSNQVNSATNKGIKIGKSNRSKGPESTIATEYSDDTQQGVSNSLAINYSENYPVNTSINLTLKNLEEPIPAGNRIANVDNANQQNEVLLETTALDVKKNLPKVKLDVLPSKQAIVLKNTPSNKLSKTLINTHSTSKLDRRPLLQYLNRVSLGMGVEMGRTSIESLYSFEDLNFESFGIYFTDKIGVLASFPVYRPLSFQPEIWYNKYHLDHTVDAAWNIDPFFISSQFNVRSFEFIGRANLRFFKYVDLHAGIGVQLNSVMQEPQIIYQDNLKHEQLYNTITRSLNKSLFVYDYGIGLNWKRFNLSWRNRTYVGKFLKNVQEGSVKHNVPADYFQSAVCFKYLIISN